MKKRRFAEGGFNDYEGALGEGTDTPDKALARKAAADVLAGRAGDKAAGLASTKGQDVGFFKRLSMGNIDAPGSEASNSFGAGKGSSDRMAQAADQDPPVRPVQHPTPVAPVVAPTPVATKPDKFSDFGDNADVGTIEYSPVKKPVAVKKPTVKPSISASDKPMPPVGSMKNPRNAEKGMSRGRRESISESDKPQPPAGSMRGYGEIANLDSVAERDKKSKKMMKDADERDSFKRRVSSLSGNFKSGGSIKAYASGGSVSSRADGCAQRGKTRGMMR